MRPPRSPHRARRDVFAALGRFSCRFRWLVVAVWLVLLAAGLAATPQLSHVLQGGGFTNPDSPGQKAADLIQKRLKQGPATVVVVFVGDSLDARSPEFQRYERQALAELTAARIPGLRSIATYATSGAEQLLAKDGRSSVAILTFDADSQAVQQETGRIRAALGKSRLKAYVSGEPAVNADLSSASLSDLRRVELYALPVALIALVVVFGTLVAAALPVITGGLAVSVTMGGIYLLARVTNMSIFSMNTATLLGLAVAIDYALFIVARFREELRSGSSVEEAVVTSMSRAGRSVFYSGVAVIVGIVGLTFFPSPILRSIGIGGALVVFFSVAAALTFMPALLALLGSRVNALAVVPQRPPHESRFWTGWTRFLLRRPWAVIVVSLALALLIASPALRMRSEMPSAAALPPSSQSRQGYEVLARGFDQSALSPLSVLATWQDGGGRIDMSRAASLYAFGQLLARTPGVRSVSSPFNLPFKGGPLALAGLWPLFEKLLNDPGADPGAGVKLPPGMAISGAQLAQIRQLLQSSVGPGAALFRVVTKAPPSSAEAQRLVGTIAGLKAPPGLRIHVAGQAATDRDFADDRNSRLPWVAVWIAVTSYLVLLVLLRSVLLPLVAVLVNMLTILMSYGCLVFIFQRATFQDILHFTSTGATDATIPIVILCVLFGITMDYAVFLLTRMREAWLTSADNRESVGAGLVSSGRIVLSAAILVVVVTGAFAFTGVSVTKMLGVGVALAVVLDALLIRMSLLPASMCYFGAADWWAPRRRRRPAPAPAEDPGRD